MKKNTTVLLILLLTLSLFSVACSNDEAISSEETTSTVQTETSVDDSNEETMNETLYPMTYVDMAEREIYFESQPQRIAISYLPHWETLIMLDTTPIATNNAKHYAETWDAFQGYEGLSSVVDLGATEVNLELLTSLEPDLILEQTYDISSYDIENLEKIAPVAVFGSQVKMDWRFSLREIGKCIGKAERAEEVIEEINGKLASYQDELKEANFNDTVMLMSMMGEDRYFIAYRPDLYDEESGLGLIEPDTFTTSENYEQISMESIVEMNPDYLFVNVFDGDEALFEALNENPVWQSLTAYKNGHIYRIDGSGHAASVISTVYTVDFITGKLLDED